MMDEYKRATIVIEHPEYIYTVDMSALYPSVILTNLFPDTEEEE
tara:strand:- start:186 stop:317 length:132 start_codon:yes stop_codon:yes gene_type:complete